MNGFTTIPRWTTDPAPGVGEHALKIPGESTAALRRLAADMKVPISSVLLAACARVLSALSGEQEVRTGYALGAGLTVPLRLTLGARTWRELILETAKAESEMLSDAAISDGPPGGPPEGIETVFDVAGEGLELDADTVLRLAFVQHGGLTLNLQYRQDAADMDYAARLAGYCLRAFSLMTAHPDSEHAAQSLLSDDEFQSQIHEMAGPRRELPDLRVHEIFEEQARLRPDEIAAEQGDVRLTYRELNARANRLARALAARGVGAEAVVGVVTKRNLDWMTAVWAIFKSGGAYLPIEPQFPADRIARTLSRAGCRLVLTEQGSTEMLDGALATLPTIETLFIDAALAEGHADGNLGIPIGTGQLAYIYFTSGSTGEPKGAMCEHGGMVNHLFAKIDDLGIGQGDVVAQIAPQCFDISLWQLVSALLVGGRTLIVEQETILDAERFLDRIVEGKVAVMQVVPSYLEVLVSSLVQRPRTLPHLRAVSATGEALKLELVQRWFAVQPGIRLLNAYGLTETSDDTNHELMERPPAGDRVPLGRPVNNVQIYVVDERLSPVPLGAPGEIVFSGICVGRGYINDPDRTARAFVADPHRKGQRLYRSGDFGRWMPDKKLEFLGRRDSQVKISGFRIEIGEIEDRLLRLPGVRDGAVVVTGGDDRGKQLVAFYSGDPWDPATMRDRLAESLPKYMVPAAFLWRDALPLTGNGKIDKKALTAFAADAANVQHDAEAMRTETERWLAAAWAGVLGIPVEKIGRRDHFFELGGTSLSAVRLAIAIERAISFKEIAQRPILAEQAELIESRLEQSGTHPAVTVPAAQCATSVTTSATGATGASGSSGLPGTAGTSPLGAARRNGQ